MNFLKEEINGKFSIKRVAGAVCTIVAIVFAALTLGEYALQYVYFFGGAGLAALGLTVFNNHSKLKFGNDGKGHPDPDDDEDKS